MKKLQEIITKESMNEALLHEVAEQEIEDDEGSTLDETEAQ